VLRYQNKSEEIHICLVMSQMRLFHAQIPVTTHNQIRLQNWTWLESEGNPCQYPPNYEFWGSTM